MKLTHYPVAKRCGLTDTEIGGILLEYGLAWDRMSGLISEARATNDIR